MTADELHDLADRLEQANHSGRLYTETLRTEEVMQISRDIDAAVEFIRANYEFRPESGHRLKPGCV